LKRWRLEVARTEELFANPRHPYTQGLLQAIPRLEPGRASEAVAVEGDPGGDRGVLAVPFAEAAARRVHGLRHVQRPSDRRGLTRGYG